MRNLVFGAAALAVLAGTPVAAQSICEKMQRQYAQGYCDGNGAFHPGNGTIITPDGRSSPERAEPNDRRIMRAMPPVQSIAPRPHSGTSGAPQ